ncbi:hypothetical protein CON65_01110 [Bacillus pseudomycoides]|uniref:DUF485 domain-containing protein n=1 Tax=Bacillus pseudomycoides TaxID=64104 RepID=A0AA91VG45_9BACI|nr:MULTISPECIES: DUF485 domain-containing protein [Bacillus]PEB54111.1 hypothetical protein COO03_06185 [Bacillus sp. AFS098217]PED84411.1 hypothetical protein CON65_01110 [Bacillus pseudomycoides]PEU09490.1 hypothetical protein CN524_18290 [Bacillus sp. AFS019443]PEU13709.1 hypothetical protein CN525_18940 [Bacillus sp. AFS014408]PFW65486.1 hypothetical protein COL20_00395 [Bacillus sp. AFS075034]
MIKSSKNINYKKIANSEKFKELLNARKKFTVSVTIFFICFALLLPILTLDTDILTKPAIGAISWAWIFAFAQFVMTGVICHLYVKKAAYFDTLAEEVLTEEAEGRQADGF